MSENVQNFLLNNLTLFEMSIPNFIQIKNEDWFKYNVDLQKKLFWVISLNGSDKIDINNDDFENHINKLFRELLFEYFETQINDFSYLKEKEWFYRSTNLQLKLYTVCKKGFGDKVNVVTLYFEDHLNELLE